MRMPDRKGGDMLDVERFALANAWAYTKKRRLMSPPYEEDFEGIYEVSRSGSRDTCTAPSAGSSPRRRGCCSPSQAERFELCSQYNAYRFSRRADLIALNSIRESGQRFVSMLNRFSLRLCDFARRGFPQSRKVA